MYYYFKHCQNIIIFFAASYLAGRSWQGLQPQLGQTAVVKAVEGRRGIAIAYEEEGLGNRDSSTIPHQQS